MTLKKRTVVRTNNRLTDSLIANLLVDYHENEMTYAAIGRKYDLCYDTIRKAILNNKYDPKLIVHFDPTAVIQRQKLSNMEREEKVGDDALTATEMIFAIIRKQLEIEINSTVQKIEIKELTALFEKVIPYVMQKRDAPMTSGKNKPTQKAKIHQMFKVAN